MFATSDNDPPITAFELLGEVTKDPLTSSTSGDWNAMYSKEKIETVAKVHDGPIFLQSSPDELLGALFDIIKIAFIISIVHIIVLKFYQKHRANVNKTSTLNEKNSEKDISKAALENYQGSYQMTNMIVNFFLGCLGIYHYINLPSSTTIVDRISTPHYAFFASLQIGYQLWALPVGIFVVKERKEMLIHHVCVIVIASMSYFCIAGFRYHCPFFYGLIEISSVPLSVMNMFRNNRKWIEEMPHAYTVVKLIFASIFLIVRVVMWIPQMLDFLYIISLCLLSCQHGFCYAVNGVNFFNGIFLTYLQLLWASKIVKGLLQIFKGNKDKENSDTKKQK